MKTTIKLVTVLATLSLLASSAFASVSTTGLDGGRMYLFRVAGYYSASGGEFTLQKDGLPKYLGNTAYASVAKSAAANSFQTFCMERDEFIVTPVDITVSTTNVDASGNDVGPGSHAVQGGVNTNNGDNLDPKTAYLYTQFAQGVLAGYDYTVGAGRVASADALQKAIWYIEGEVPTLAAGLATTFYNDAVNAGWNDIGNVRVLNLYAAGYRNNLGFAKQDMLYLIPAPAAAVLGLLGLGLVGWVKRRMA